MADGAQMPAVEGRVPPHDLDAEGAVLSAVMADPVALDKVNEFLRPEHFYSEAHRRTFEACVALSIAAQPVDIVTVGTWLKDHDRLAQVGGMAYLTEVLNAAPSVANVAQYGKTIQDKWRVRSLIVACQRITSQGYAGYGDAREFVNDAAQSVSEIATADAKRSLVAIGTTLGENWNALLAALRSGRSMLGTPTGFRRFDRLVSGLHDGELTIVAARPGMGKTALVLNIAANIARAVDVAPVADALEPEVLVFSLEMPREQLVNRMLCTEAGVEFSAMRSGTLTPLDWSKLTQAAQKISPMRMHIDDTPTITPVDLRAKVRGHANECARRKKRVALVAVDYLQLMRGSGNASSREQEIAEISRSLKGIAKELEVPVIALSQLNRKLEDRADKRPQLSDLRESGAIEQDADNVVFIHRDDYFKKKDCPNPGVAELIVAKQRNGPTETVLVRFEGRYTRFVDLLEESDDGREGGGAWNGDRD